MPKALEQIRDLTRGGVHYAFEMAGSVKAMELAYAATRRGGTTVTAGLSNPKHLFSIPHVGIVAEERTIKGSYLGSCDPARDIPRYIDLYRAGRLPIDRLLSERIALDRSQRRLRPPRRRPHRTADPHPMTALQVGRSCASCAHGIRASLRSRLQPDNALSTATSAAPALIR